MRFDNATLDGIIAGLITFTFRAWDRPRVLVGTQLRTRRGVVEVTSVDKVGRVSRADALAAGFASLTDLKEFLAKKGGDTYRIGLVFAGEDHRIALRESTDVGGLDEALSHKPWAMDILYAIDAQPAVLSTIIADQFGWERAPFKRRVRQLKELGLTESLEVGYRISPRGKAYLASKA
ncbi:hypothetical protein GCM10007304_05690 [Rhodococcoides trifolii]|uniref:ASCH domain-containing protein n=1 Tax=Rhodococcoides trifolii TaxID=908250 RepID=A0A917CS76_9NOCA|nr:ASCH domain-containing protein [Rhodococcus trifolii]GGF94699.1 hypothetical protein GCM10007304_05690 [Rhodococcus trifolii]